MSRCVRLLGATAVAASLSVAPAAATTPSTSRVNAAVKKKFNAQYDEGGNARCRRAGQSSWDCQIRTETDRLRVANAVASGSGQSISEAQRSWYSYRCTARYSNGRIIVGRFVEHDYDH